jgi:hypothetical protein
MGVPDVLALIAIVIAGIVEFEEKARNLLGWAVILIGVALLWGRVF